MCDMIQLYKNNQIRERDKLTIAGSIEKHDVYEIEKEIQNLKEERSNFYHIGSGSGKLLCQISLISDFKKYIGVDSVLERIKFSNSLISNFKLKNIEFQKNDLHKIDISENSVVFLNDITMTPEETNNIFEKLPIGTLLICFNNPKSVLPIKATRAVASWNKFLTKKVYFYLKSQ